MKRTETTNGPLMTLPEYFHLNNAGKKPEWQWVKDVSADSGLT